MWWVARSSTHDDDHTEVVSRALHALHKGLEELEKWYKSLDNCEPFNEETRLPPNHPRFFPFTRCYSLRTKTGSTMVEFDYIAPLQPDLSTCCVFHAKTKESPPRDIVVKFVQRYSRKVHAILAEVKMAPALLYYGRLDHGVAAKYGRRWRMVVMDYFKGQPSYEGERHKNVNVAQQVLKAINLVHKHGYVLGDVRPPNVVIGEENVVKLIDFDWSGKWKEGDGGVQYPAYMSKGIWVDGVEPTGKIEKSHDLAMHEKWFSPSSPAK